MDEIQELNNLLPKMLSSEPFEFSCHQLCVNFVGSVSIASFKIGIKNLKTETDSNAQGSMFFKGRDIVPFLSP
jgi:hypothetical protein